MRKNIGRTAALCTFVLAVAGGNISAYAAAAGPDYPPPGGVSWFGAGEMGRAGGAIWSYEDLDMSQFLDLWWGPAGADGVQIALDGAIDEPGETLAFSAEMSCLECGFAWWIGESDMLLTSGPQTFPTGLVIGSPSALAFEADAGVTGPGALVPVTGDFAVSLHLGIYYDDTWHYLLDGYDELHQNPPVEGGAVTSISGGFYYNANQAPTAGITSDPSPPIAGEEATLSANAEDVDGTVELIEWDTDDDGFFDNGTGASIAYTFPAAGTYQMAVRVTDDRGLSATAAATITVHRCDEGVLSGPIHENVEPLADVHALNCEVVAGLGL